MFIENQKVLIMIPWLIIVLTTLIGLAVIDLIMYRLLTSGDWDVDFSNLGPYRPFKALWKILSTPS